MAWTTMHFATGMCCGAVVATTACVVLRRSWRWVPLIMTVGGFWAMAPDYPRIFREDFPNVPFAAVLGSKTFEAWLNRWGNAFCFHRLLDDQPHEYALAGLVIILLLYNAVILLMMWGSGNQAATRPQIDKVVELPSLTQPLPSDTITQTNQPSDTLHRDNKAKTYRLWPPRSRRAS